MDDLGQIKHYGQIVAYENGELDEQETVELFQGLINSGLAWTLQGHYGRTARRLIDAGRCIGPKMQEWRIL